MSPVSRPVQVLASARFDQVPDGSLWTSNASLGYDFWTRYLDVFPSVRLFVRVRKVQQPPSPGFPVTADFVQAVPLPDFRSPWAYLRRRAELSRAINAGLEEGSPVIMRLPATAAWTMFRALPRGYPFGVEVVGDPWEVFAPGNTDTLWRGLIRYRQSRIQRKIVRDACAAAYVTRHALQDRYPASVHAHQTWYSSVVLRSGDFVATPRTFENWNGPPRLVTVGSLDRPYKGIDTLIQAVTQYVRSWGPLTLRILGDGKLRAQLEQDCHRRGIHDRVTFLGHVRNHLGVIQELDRADLFVLASRTEGLPRALLEAMARGLPCLGSRVGGIPELLHEDSLFPKDHPVILAEKLHEVLRDPERMTRMARENWTRAGEYGEEQLRPRRIAFYRHVAEATQDWLQSQTCSRGHAEA